MATIKKSKSTKSEETVEITTPKLNNKELSFFSAFVSAENMMDISLSRSDEEELAPIDVIDTGSYSLNDALGCNGLPCGRLIQYYGSPGSGKTLMAMIAIINAQRKDPTAKQLFIDAEQTFDKKWAKKLGADPSKIIVVDGETAVYGRKCFEMLLGIPKEDLKTHAYVGKKEMGLLDRIKNKEFNINLIVLDSLGTLIPPGEDTSRVGKMNMALMARFLGTSMKKLSIEVSKANIPMIVINHIKATMEMYGPDHTSSGGNSYFHTLSANIFFEQVTRKEAQILDEEENKIGGTIRYTIEKSKFGPYPKRGEFRLLFNRGIIDKHLELITLGLKYGVIKMITKMSYDVNGEKVTGGLPGLHRMFENNDEKSNWLLNQIIEAKNNGVEETAIPLTSDDDEDTGLESLLAIAKADGDIDE
jgi:recombination protein RecA